MQRTVAQGGRDPFGRGTFCLVGRHRTPADPGDEEHAEFARDEVMMVKSAKTPTRKRKTIGKSIFKLSKDTQQLIKQEAHSLSMSPDEYSRLTAHLFATLRKALAQKQAVDGKGLLNVVENPLFGLVIQYMADQINKTGGDGGSEGKQKGDTPIIEAPRTPSPDLRSPFGTPQPTQPIAPSRPGTTPNQMPIDWDYW